MKKAIALVLFSMIVSTQAFALKEYYALSRSIRSLGMGGAYYALSDDEYALFYNPAGLGFRRQGGEGMLAFNTHVASRLFSAVKTFTTGDNKKINEIVDKVQSFQGTPLYGSVGIMPYYVNKNFAVSLLVAEPKFDFALLGRDFDSAVDLTAIVDSGLLMSYAHTFLNDKLSIGVTGKGLFRAGGKKQFILTDLVTQKDFKIDPKELGGAGGGVDFDLGAIYELPELPFGSVTRVSLTFSNLLASQFTISRQGGRPPSLARSMSLGAYTIFPGWMFIDNFHVLFDLAEFGLGGEGDGDYGARNGSVFKHVNLGVEMPISGWLVPRIGLHQGYLTAGIGVNVRLARLEFATYSEELSSSPGRLGSRRFALRLALGFAAASNPPYSATATTPDAKPAEPEKETPKEDPKENDAKVVPPTPMPATPAPISAPPPTPPAPTPTTPPAPGPGKQGASDPFQVDRYVETKPASPSREPASEVPSVRGTKNDRFGIDQMKGEDPGTL